MKCDFQGFLCFYFMENKLNIRQFFILFSYGKSGKWAFSCGARDSHWDLKLHILKQDIVDEVEC